MKFDADAFLERLKAQKEAGAIRAICAIPDGSNSTNSRNSTQPAPQSESANVTDLAEWRRRGMNRNSGKEAGRRWIK